MTGSEVGRVGALLGYARVSTAGQNLRMQQEALRDAGCSQIYEEVASGISSEKPEQRAILKALRQGDTLVVWKLDRLGRSFRDLTELLAELEDRGIIFRSLQENIDTSSPIGRFTAHLLASIAEMEREMIRERSEIGRAAARRAGRIGGRPPKLTPQDIAKVHRLRAGNAEKWTMRHLAELFSVSPATIIKALKSPVPQLLPLK